MYRMTYTTHYTNGATTVRRSTRLIALIENAQAVIDVAMHAAANDERTAGLVRTGGGRASLLMDDGTVHVMEVCQA